MIIGEDGYARITDFGLSKMMLTEFKTKTFCGTPEYMAPEIITGLEYTTTVDWWAFGAFLYEMVVGTPPFKNENRQLLYTSIKNDKPVIPQYLSSDLQDLISRLLEKDPDKRISSANEIKSHLWFKTIDWEKMYDKKLEPPFIPYFTSNCDTRNFDKDVTEEQIKEQKEFLKDQSAEIKERSMWKDFEYSEESC